MSNKTGALPVTEPETVKASVLMMRLGVVLDDVCRRLSDVQCVVSDYVGTGHLDQNQMERLQGLDALTQEVEAVRAVLEKVEQVTPVVGEIQYAVGNVLAGVRLSQIRDMLRYGKTPDRQESHGDFTLF